MADAAMLQQIKALIEEREQGGKNPLPSFTAEEMSAMYALAYEMYRNGKYTEAKPFFRFLTILCSTDGRYWMGLGACYQMEKKYTAAIECYSVAAMQNPKDPMVHWHAANCFFADGKLEAAIKTLDSALAVAKLPGADEALVDQFELVHSRWIEIEGTSCQL